ncbi:MAG: modified peptide precursor CbpA [Magnetococcales bacterium]|nr:modified peptide precursor CbpA [Magnetococcales bacterium]
MQQEPKKKQESKKINVDQPVRAVRKSCTADGVGLSHYILMDEKAK